MEVAFAEGDEASISLDSPSSSQSYKPGDNVQISGKAQNTNQVAILVRNAGGGIAYAAQPPVENGAFSTEFQLNDDAVEGQYTIKIGAEGLAVPVDFTFKVSKSDTPSSGGGGGGGAATPQAVASTTGTATVAPAAGGTISLGNEATVVVPAGALTGASKVEVKVQKITSPPAVPAGFRLAGSVYEFSVGGESSYSFAKDVTIRLSFDPNLIGAGETPAIGYYDETLGQWVNLGGTVSGNTVTVQVNHFTKFAVLAAVREAETGPAGTTAATLKDLTGHWALSNINKLVALGAIDGYPDGSFKPDNTITRAEFATVLVKAFQLENKGGKVFADTAAHWAKDYIAAAAANGVVNGYEDNTFGPDDLITREQMAVMVVKAAKLAPATGQSQFADSGSISGWAGEAIATATGNGIMKGYPDNTVRPLGSATRAEAVTVIVNALNK
ncbi:S-layer homology domain-containing protein [Pelotomaculum schinkii]|nr:S-layer homology domain-containing protein [Pelotomaculum schinkii]